jgi:hypothetical protein
MEIFGGFMVMMSIIGLFLAVIWLIMPFVVFAIKGKQDKTLEVLEGIEKRLAALETNLQRTRTGDNSLEPLAVLSPTLDSQSRCSVENNISSREPSV